MEFLLDTHTFLWFAWGDTQLSVLAKRLIEDEGNVKFVSMASIWEMAIKVNTGKLTLNRPYVDFLVERLDGNGFDVLPIERPHAELTAILPFHHRDPFDRLLIAQCISNSLPLIGNDVAFDAYGV